MKPEDICPRPEFLPDFTTSPMAPPIYPAAVYRCRTPEEARQLLAGEIPGYIYSRDGHPNGDLLAEKCKDLHRAEHAIICGSGMAALSVGILSQLAAGDHLVASCHLYGRTLQFAQQELAKFQVDCTLVDTCDLEATEAAMQSNTKLILVETISNPLLRVADIKQLAEIAHQRQAKLLVDNSFAGPMVCRPLELGADLAMESLTKIMNGHSDVLLGAICGKGVDWERIETVTSVWGLSSSPFDCWLACRGLGTMALRVERANENALKIAKMLSERDDLEVVHYPGVTQHADHQLASDQFGNLFGSIVTFTLKGNLENGSLETASQFISDLFETIPFSPSLGDLSTTLSHPASTSHRGLTVKQRADLGIFDGTIRLSVGIESIETILDRLQFALDRVK